MTFSKVYIYDIFQSWLLKRVREGSSFLTDEKELQVPFSVCIVPDSHYEDEFLKAT